MEDWYWLAKVRLTDLLANVFVENGLPRFAEARLHSVWLVQNKSENILARTFNL